MRHSGYSFGELQNTIREMVNNIPNTIETLNNFKKKILTEQEKMELALKSIEIRFGEETEVTPIDLLEAIREEDKKDDLWTIFNVIQEKLIRGGFRYKNRQGKMRRARKISNFVKDISINQKLFELANEYTN